MASMTLTQSLGLQTKQYLDNAHQRQDAYATHLVGRFRLLGTTVVGAVEVIVRLALFLLGHIAGVFCLYQSNDINQFLKDQARAGFSASIITSAGLFSLLSPNLFRGISFPQEPNQVRRDPALQESNPARVAPLSQEPIRPEEAELQPLRHRAVLVRESAIEERCTNLIVDIVTLPFKMVAFFFKLPFYFIYLSFQLGVVLPIRLALLPFQIFIRALSFERPRVDFELNLIS